MGQNQKNGSNSLGRRSRGQRPGCFEVHMDSPNQWCCRFSGANSFVPNHLYEKCEEDWHNESLQRMLREFAMIFGKKFWDNAIMGFSFWRYDKFSIDQREDS